MYRWNVHQKSVCYRCSPFTIFLGITLFVLGGALPIGACAEDQPEKTERVPVPDAAAREKADKSVQEVFGEEIAHAKTSAEQVALVEKLMGIADEEKDLSQRYAVLMLRAVAIASGDIRSAMRVVDKLVSEYRIDASRGELITLQALAKSANTKGQQAKLAEAAASAVDRAIARDAVDAAIEFNQIAGEAARRAGDAELHKRVAVREKELQENLREFKETKPYREKLTADPDDPAANLALGKYHCFYRRDWPTGLPLLAKGEQAGLKAAATKDLNNPSKAADMGRLADLWWELGDSETGRAQEAMRSRASHWYHEALPELTGLAKAKAEKRLASGETPPAAAEEPRRPAGRTAGGSNVAQRALLEYTAQQVKAGKTAKSAEQGFTLGNEAFTIAPDGGGILVGLDVSIGNFNKITGIRPQFLTSKGIVPGQVIGEVSVHGTSLTAKRGYAIGAITVKGGIGIDGLSVTYMPIEEDGLNVQRPIESNMLGNATEGTRLGGDGGVISGIFGHHDKKKVAALGVITVERRK